MENNNSIHPDEMERLLREAFLDSPESETDKISDMMANHVYNNNWNIVPPVDKAQHFVPKKYFFKGFSLNSIIISTVIATTISVGAYVFFSSDKKTVQNKQEPQPITQTIPVTDTTISIPENTTQVVYTEVKRITKPSTPNKPVKVDTNAAPPKLLVNSIPAPQKSSPKRYVLIPVITANEAAQNEKRKAEMIKKISREDRNEWAYIPSGTATIDHKTVSVHAFFMQTHEISNLQYRTFLYDLVINDKLREYEKAAVYDSGWIHISKLEMFAEQYFWHPSFNDYPVVNITLEGAQMYCDWLTRLVNDYNKEKGKPYINDIRIPTVEEWIYAAKADNDSAIYAWGGPFYRNSKGLIMGNFKSGRNLNDHDGADVTAPVGSFYPNLWGLHNMSGNVAEMTQPYADGTLYIKGGAWNLGSDYMKVEHKHTIHVDQTSTTNVGFRPVFTFFAR